MHNKSFGIKWTDSTECGYWFTASQQKPTQAQALTLALAHIYIQTSWTQTQLTQTKIHYL